MKAIILVLSVLFCTFGYGQRMIMDIIDPAGANLALQSGTTNNTLVGSMYLTDWRVGYIYYGTKKEEKKLRYNAYKDAIHVMNAQGQELVIEKGQVEAFSIVDNNKEYLFKWIMNIPKIDFGYLQVIYEGKVKVYYRHHRKIKQSVSQTEGYAGSISEDHFVDDNAFVIELPNGTKYLTDARKKEILNIFSDKRKELETYIKTKKLDTQKLKDLMEVVQQYESYLH